VSARRPHPAHDERTEIIRTEESRTTSLPPGEETVEAGPGIVREDQHVRVRPDGTVERRLDRADTRPVRRRPVEHLGPWLLAFLLLVLGGLAAAWYLTRDETRAVPGVTGLPLNEAVAELQDDGFRTDIVAAPSDEEEGLVFAQDPAAGSDQDEGAVVRITVSEGPATVGVPNAVGLAETEARDRLAEVGLQANVAQVFSEEPEGQVVAQNPAAGEQAPPDSAVRLNVSRGPGTVTVPDLVGIARADAEGRLDELGLTANVVEVPSDEAPGTVVAQNPTAGDVDVGSSVRLNVSAGD
jgi:serine/threonine-protein kinase